jgi:hypothetical protein
LHHCAHAQLLLGVYGKFPSVDAQQAATSMCAVLGVYYLCLQHLEGVTRTRWPRGAGTKYHSFRHRVEVTSGPGALFFWRATPFSAVLTTLVFFARPRVKLKESTEHRGGLCKGSCGFGFREASAAWRLDLNKGVEDDSEEVAACHRPRCGCTSLPARRS